MTPHERFTQLAEATARYQARIGRPFVAMARQIADVERQVLCRRPSHASRKPHTSRPIGFQAPTPSETQR